MQILYEWDFHEGSQLQGIVARNLGLFADGLDQEYVITSVEGVKNYLKKIDDLIIQVAPDWPIDQVAYVDKAILRLSIYEILHNTDVPPKVAINEAVELAKTFGGENSSKFVNGVLGTIYRNSDRYHVEESSHDEKIQSPSGSSNSSVNTEIIWAVWANDRSQISK